jgi:ribosomal protein S18 acetylase RimI-like enzyme
MTIRAVRFKDLQAVREIFISAFREEYGRRGVDIGAQVTRWRKLYPLIRVLGCFPNPYRYMLNLQVFDDGGTIRGFIQTTPGNSECSRWHIDYVAVAPDSQGRGVGAKLVESVFDKYGSLGVKSFTLEVDVLNAPALRLYEKLGFRQYANVTYTQMEKAPPTQGLSQPGLRAYTSADAQGLFELYLACTPAPVRLVDTRKPGDFALGMLERGMANVRRQLKHVADERSVVEVDGKIVAYLRVMAQMRALPHTVHLMVNPGYEHLYAPLLDHAAAVLAGYGPQQVLSWAPDYQPAKQQALEAWGMQTLTVDRCLVRDTMIALKLPIKDNVSVVDEKAFKPAYTQKI